MDCKCYRAERNFLGKVGVCFGTKERDPCSCGGDKRKCDFYPEKTITIDGGKVFKFMLDDEDSQIQVIKDFKKYGLAIMKPITNADRIRAMTDEELAEWLDALITHCNDGPCFNCFMQKACLTSMIEWLKQEVDTNDS